MSNEKFIFTKDQRSANKLREAGYIQIPTAIDFLFLNERHEGANMMFEDIMQIENLVFTSKICL